jgi:hypothetical protein
MNPLLLSLIEPAANVIGGLVTKNQTQKQLQDSIDRAEAARIAKQKAADDARANMKGFTMGPGARQAFLFSQQRDNRDFNEAQRLQSSMLEALGRSGPQGLQNIAAAARASEGAKAKATAAQRERQQTGLDAFAEEQQRIGELETNRVNELQSFDLGRALRQVDQATLTRNQRQGEFDANKLAFTNEMLGIGSEALGSIVGGIAEAGSFGEFAGFGEQGAKIKETPGEFSHKTNPIDLIRRNENGDKEKVGEVTGGEVIFNPEQSGKLEQLASDGDTDLHRYLRGLFKKFNTKK